MGDLNLHARKMRLTAELLKGKDIATQLLNLLKNTTDAHHHHGGRVSAQDLSLQILRSFDNTLAELSSCDASAESTQIPDTVDCPRKKNPAVVKNRRGCYKRRRTVDSWTVESSTAEDGFAWKKYGQKLILSCHYPRCYYSCSHKYEGCKATKQVQIIREKPTLLYQTTYMNHHSCSSKTPTVRAYNPSELVEPKNLIGFKATHSDIANWENPTTVVPVKPEEQTDEVIPSDATSTTLVKEDNLVESGQEGMVLALQSSESTTLLYGMDINDHFGDHDIEGFFWFVDDDIGDDQFIKY